MTPTIARALAAVCAALAIVAGAAAGVAYVRGLRADLATANQAAAAARQGNTDRDAVIKTLRKEAKDNAAARAQLESDIEGIRGALGAREMKIRRLINENTELRAWADVALPGVIVGLHDHPAITGADGYQAYLRARETLHAAGDKPTQ